MTRASHIARLAAAVEAVMSGHTHGRRGLAAALQGAAALYGIAVRGRAELYRRRWRTARRLPCRVVSVGNIALGGTGKTPMTLYLAELLRKAGCRTAVVSRGYKGAAEKRGGVVSDGRTLLMGPAEAGDEPWLMASRLLPLGVPVLVGRDRLRSGWEAVRRFQAEVVLLDDGFQHLGLQRELDLVLLDAAAPFGNGRLLPRGTLREPPAALRRADACLLTRSPRAAFQSAGGPRMLFRPGQPVFPAAHAPFPAEWIAAGQAAPPVPGLAARAVDTPVFAFSGIARNDAFRRSLEEMGFRVAGGMDFADHHVYTSGELRALAAAARRCGAAWMTTTEKDRVKIAAEWIQDPPLLVVGVRMDLGGNAEAFEDFVRDRLGLGPRPGSAAV